MVLDESSWDGDGAPQFPGGLHYADDKISAFLQGSTQYDALGHVWYDNQLYNGYDPTTTIGGLQKCSIEPIANRFELLGRQMKDRSIVDMPKIDPIKDAVEKIGTLLHAFGHGIDRGNHPLPVFPLDHHYHLVIVAERIFCRQVLVVPICGLVF